MLARAQAFATNGKEEGGGRLPSDFTFLEDASLLLRLFKKDPECFAQLVRAVPSLLRDPTVFNRARRGMEALVHEVAPRDPHVARMLRAFKPVGGGGRDLVGGTPEAAETGKAVDATTGYRPPPALVLKREEALEARRARGDFDSRETKEERKRAAIEAQKQKTRETWASIKRQQLAEEAQQGAWGGSMGTNAGATGTGSGTGTGGGTEAQFLSAAHAQAGQAATGEVRETLLEQGLDALRYVEGAAPQWVGTRGVRVANLDAARKIKQPRGCEGGTGNGVQVWGCAKCGWRQGGNPCPVPTHLEEGAPGRAASERICVKLDEE